MAWYQRLGTRNDSVLVLRARDASLVEQQLTLAAALKLRFGRQDSTDNKRDQLTSWHHQVGETLRTLAADVHFNTQHGYPTFDLAAREELAFIPELTPDINSIPASWHQQPSVLHWKRLRGGRLCCHTTHTTNLALGCIRLTSTMTWGMTKGGSASLTYHQFHQADVTALWFPDVTSQ